MMNQQVSEPCQGVLEAKLIEVLDEFEIEVPRREYGAMNIIDAKRSYDSIGVRNNVNTVRTIVKNHDSYDGIRTMWAIAHARVAKRDKNKLTRRGRFFCYTQDFENAIERVEFNYRKDVANVSINYDRNNGQVEVEFLDTRRKIELIDNSGIVARNLVETCVRANYE